MIERFWLSAIIVQFFPALTLQSVIYPLQLSC